MGERRGVTRRAAVMRRCPRCRSGDHEAYACMLEGEGSPDGEVVRLTWSDVRGRRWRAHVCRDHLAGFVEEHLRSESLVALRRGQESVWERACDVCLGRIPRTPLRLVHLLDEAADIAHSPVRLASAIACTLAALAALLTARSILPGLTRWQVVWLALAAAALAPHVRDLMNRAVLDLGVPLAASVRHAVRRPGRVRQLRAQPARLVERRGPPRSSPPAAR